MRKKNPSNYENGTENKNAVGLSFRPADTDRDDIKRDDIRMKIERNRDIKINRYSRQRMKTYRYIDINI